MYFGGGHPAAYAPPVVPLGPPVGHVGFVHAPPGPFGAPQAEVVLNIYDLGQSAMVGFNNLLRAVGSGAFHAGVEVLGQEWSYGCAPGPNMSGIFCNPPRDCGAHKFRESVPMGLVQITEGQVMDLIEELSLQWPADGYDLLRRNCCHFSDTLCVRLGVGPVPPWVTNLAGVGAMLRSNLRLGVKAVQDGAKAAVGAGEPRKLGAARLDAGYVDAQRVDAPAGPYPMDAPARPKQPPPMRVVEYCYMQKGIDELKARGLEEMFGNPSVGDTIPPHLMNLIAAKIADPVALVRDGLLAEIDNLTYADGPLPEAKPSGPQVGDGVEVFSRSHDAWCLGRVESCEGQAMVVSFEHPGAGPGELTKKVLDRSKDSKDVRMAPKGVTPLKPAARVEDGVQVGDQVEVFSNSQQVWCPGHIESLSGNMVTVAFLVPGSGPGEYSRKVLPIDHSDWRRSRQAAPQQQQPNLARATSHVQQQPHLARATSPVSARGDAAGAGRPAQVNTYGGYSVGDKVETFSNSNQVWCRARIESIDANGMVTLAYWLPGAFPDQWKRKELPADHKDLRKNAPAVPKASPPQMTSPFDTGGGGGGAGAGAGTEAAAAPAPAPPAPPAPAVPTAGTGAGQGSSGADAAGVVSTGSSGQSLKAGDKVEVFSVSQQAWVPAQVEAVDAGMVTVLYMARGAQERAQKVLPANHFHLRTAAQATASATSVPSSGGSQASEATANEFVIGENVEVFSNSRQVWCPGCITQIQGPIITVAFQFPEDTSDEWIEKQVVLGRGDLRRPGKLETTGASAREEAKVTLTAVEEESYGQLFQHMLKTSQGESAVTSSASETVDAQVMAEYLKSSGLERRVLKEVWKVGNPDLASQCGFEVFSICCRLVGHCQAMMKGNFPPEAAQAMNVTPEVAAAAMMETAGEPLRQLLDGRFRLEPPPKPPAFAGGKPAHPA